MFRAAYLLLLLAAGLLPLVGCGPRGPKAKYKIAVVPKGLTHEFWQSIERGARRAAADLAEQGIPVEVLWDGPRKESDASEQISIVKRLVGRGANALVLAPQDSKAMVPVVEEVAGKDVPVVIIDSGLDQPDLYLKYVATHNYNGGKFAARRLLAVLAKEGKKAPKLVLFRYAVGSESTEQREKGFLDEVKNHKGAEVIDDREYAGATVDSAQKAAGPLLGRVKDTADGIFAVNESATTGLLNAMRSRRLIGKIQVMGFDSSEALRQSLQDGEVCGLIVQDPYRMGYLGLWHAVMALEGYDVSGKDKNLSTGEELVTREKLAEAATRGLFDPEAQAERTIKVPTYQKKKR